MTTIKDKKGNEYEVMGFVQSSSWADWLCIAYNKKTKEIVQIGAEKLKREYVVK